MSWEMVKLGEICETTSGGTPSRAKNEFWDNGNIPWIKSGQLKDSNIYEAEEFITPLGLKNSSAKLIPSGTLLLALYGATAGKLGFLEVEATINQAICALTPNQELLSNRYLFYYLLSKRKKIIEDSAGGAQPNISQKYVQNIEIPLPPLSTQQRIAEILDKADALRRKDQALLKKYDDLAQAIFMDMFGDPVQNEMGWEVKMLKECLFKGEKISYGVVQPGDNFSNGIPIVRVGDFKAMKIDVSNLKMIDPKIEKAYSRTRLLGDEILIACVGSVGKIALADETLRGFNIVRATAKVRVEKSILDRVYLGFHLSQPSIQNYFISETRTSSQPTLNIKQIEETKILIPPIELQNQFQKISSNLLKQIELIEKRSSNALFQSLLQQAFKGELV